MTDKTYSRADLRLKLREAKTPTAPELAAALGVPELASRVTATLCDIVAQGGDWLERAGKDGRRVIWRYVDVVERNVTRAEPPTPFNPPRLVAPPAEPSTARRWAVAGLTPLLDELVDRVAADVERRVGKRLETLEATLKRLDSERLSPQQLRALLAADLGALEQRLYVAFGGAPVEQTAPEPEATEAPSAEPRCRKPRVLIYRVDAVKAQQLVKEFGDQLDLTVETDMSGDKMDALRYAAKRWDLVVLTTRTLGHDETEVFNRTDHIIAYAVGGFYSVRQELNRFLVRSSATATSDG